MKRPEIAAIGLATIVIGLGLYGCASAPKETTKVSEETREQKDARMAWWREAKFGLFIHWGIYSVPAGTWRDKRIDGIGEWIMHHARIPVADYAAFAKQFNPVKYDADAWVRMAKDAGMKYIVITSKHHDGFAMFHSKTSKYNVVDATPFTRDPLKELAEACRKHGIKLGFYYSQAQDWHHPGGAAAGGHWDPAQDGDMGEYIKTIAVPEVREILTGYGPIAVLWWDTPVGMRPEYASPLHELLALQPGIIENNRLGGGFPGDTETPEQFIPGTGFKDRDWETCMTMNDTWGYKSYDENWKSSRDLIRNLIDIASKGGNYLLNVGPTPEGLIPQPSIDRLKDMGDWMRANGEAIYGTQASPFKRLHWGRATRKPGRLYLHVFDWPEDGKLSVPMKNRVKKAYLLTDPGKSLKCVSNGEAVEIGLPAAAPDPVATVVVAEIDGDVESVVIPLRQADDGTIELGAAEAEIIGNSARVEGHEEMNVGYWTDPGDYLVWRVEVGKPGAFEVKVIYACEPVCAGSEYELTAGKRTLKGRNEATKDWRTYTEADLGEIVIDRAGLVEFTVKPVKMPGYAVMNWRKAVLAPR